MPPVKPMLAKIQPSIPPGMSYEPKFDGFRTIVFRDGDEVELGSRNERPMTRYFPDVVAAVQAQLPERCVVDGEIVVVIDDKLDFEALQQRIHPAASRVNMLAEQTPAAFIAFDLLALDNTAYLDRPFVERRAALEAALADAQPPVFVAPITRDVDVAQHWFEQFEGAGLDGIMAKPDDIAYVPDKRLMVKVKHERTADCVVAGFRYHKTGPVVGSLLLGLYDDEGRLRHVGVTASFNAARRKELLDELAPYRLAEGEPHPWMGEGWEFAPGAQMSRWSRGKDFSFQPLRPELVVEVAYDYMEGDRFRHTGQFRRWRPDRDPESCTFEQLDRPVRYDLNQVLSS